MNYKLKNIAALPFLVRAVVVIGFFMAFFASNTVYAFFNDVAESAWYRSYVTEASAKSWFSGDENGRFNPDSYTTRAQAAKVLFSYLCGSDLPSADGFCYSDVNAHSWYAPYVNINNKYNVIPAYGIYFEPDVYITRNDVVVALVTCTGMNVSNADISCLYQFSDWENAQEQYLPYLATAIENGILSGFEDYTLRLNAPLTRAQFAAFMSKACGVTWQQGSVDVDGTLYDTALRIRTDFFFTPSSTVKTDPDMKLAFVHYSEDGNYTFTYNSGWQQEELYIPAGCYRLVVSYKDDSAIDISSRDKVYFNYEPAVNSREPIPRTVAHRGGIFGESENTLSAFSLAADKGFVNVECDVRWTSDNTPILFHDPQINGMGSIDSLTLSQVKQFNNSSIPTFREFIELCQRKGLNPYVEIYDAGNFSHERCQGLMSIAREYGMENRITWICSYYPALKTIKTNSSVSDLRLLLVTSEEDYSLKWKLAALKTSENRVGLDINYNYVNSEYIKFMKDSGFETEAWTVNDYPTAQSLFGIGITGITTDTLLPF